MGVDQGLGDDQPEPEEERHRAFARIVGDAAGGVEEGFLEDVVGVDPPLEPAVEPDPNHPPEPVAMLRGQPSASGPLVAEADALTRSAGSHGSVPAIPNPPRPEAAPRRAIGRPPADNGPGRPAGIPPEYFLAPVESEPSSPFLVIGGSRKGDDAPRTAIPGSEIPPPRGEAMRHRGHPRLLLAAASPGWPSTAIGRGPPARDRSTAARDPGRPPASDDGPERTAAPLPPPPPFRAAAQPPVHRGPTPTATVKLSAQGGRQGPRGDRRARQEQGWDHHRGPTPSPAGRRRPPPRRAGPQGVRRRRHEVPTRTATARVAAKELPARMAPDARRRRCRQGQRPRPVRGRGALHAAPSPPPARDRPAVSRTAAGPSDYSSIPP